MLKTKIVEMPESISNPCLKCPHQNGGGGVSEGGDVEIKAEVENEEQSSRLMAALQGPGQPNSNTKGGQWQLLQCSAFFPLWDYRYVRTVGCKKSEKIAIYEESCTICIKS